MHIAIAAISACLLAAGSPAASAPPGDGGDADPTTFSFHADNRLAPLAGPGGDRLKPEDVRLDYGRRYAILADGIDVCSVEYAWALGHGGDHPVIQPRYQDLSRWDAATVENGWLAIDPATGRFKFAAANKVDDPRRVALRKQITLGNITMWQLEARGKFAFTVQEEEAHAIQAYDATDPAAFRYAGTSSMGGFPMAFVLGRDHAFVGANGYVSIHDIRDPRAIRYVKTLWTGGSERPYSMMVDLAARRFYHDSARGLQIWDIADEDDPVLIDIQEGIELPWIQVSGGYFYGIKVEASPKPMFTLLLVYRRAGERIEKVSELRIPGLQKSERNAIRELLVQDGLAFVVLSTGLHIVDVRNPSEPRWVSQIHDLGPQPEYYDAGAGAHDMALRGDNLFVACGHSLRGWVNPRETGLFRDHVDFEEKVLAPSRARDIPQFYRGGLRIYDVRFPAKPELVSQLDDEVIGYDAITNVALGDGVLFLGSRMCGVITCDISDLRAPKILGRLPNLGEVDWARLAGDKLYAMSSGVYVIEPYPAEEAKLLGFCYTNGFMFGRSIVMNPFPAENPGKFLFAATNSEHRQLTVRDPARPLMSDYKPPKVGYGRWKGNHLFSPGESALDVWRIDEAGHVASAIHFPVVGLTTHLEIHENRLFLFGLSWQVDKAVNFLHVFDIADPEKPKLMTILDGPTDSGGMFSPEVYYWRGFCFLPGWRSGRMAGCGEGGFGNFLGVRVMDLRDPDHPRLHCLIHYIPEDISIDSMNSAQSFHVAGDTLYVADYWTGLHVLDIHDLAEKRWRHIATIKDAELPWSVKSYCTSASGYGRYLYTTHFGHVNIWGIPVESDLPRGTLAVRKAEGAAAR